MILQKTVKKLLEACVTTSGTLSLIKSIDEHGIISFDVFDTLLKRNVFSPKDVFMLVERSAVNKFGSCLKGFTQERVDAERTARKSSFREDVTLDMIYEQLPYDEVTSQQLLQMELDMELVLSVPNLVMKPVYEYAVYTGKTVILMSDMYLDKAFIGKLLSKCGYAGYKELYVSSDSGLLKSTGNMFQLVLKENACKPADLLHIGDSLKADWYMPKRMGIKSVRIATHENHMLYGHNMPAMGMDYNLLYNFINNTVHGSRYFRIGYETLGPVLYGFCRWLHEYKQQLGLGKLLFFSRDGQIIWKAYKKMFPEDTTEYVYVSRRSIMVPLLHLYPIEEIIDILPLYRLTMVKTALKVLGIGQDSFVEEVIRKHGLKENMRVKKEDFLKGGKFFATFSDLKERIYANSVMEFSALKEYFRKVNLDGKTGIVDIGWRGSMQMALEKLLPFINPNVKIYGFYMGILMDSPNSYGYIYNPHRSEMKITLKSFSGLFETMFIANHGSVKCYEKGGNVCFMEFEHNRKSTVYGHIKEMQSGALSFVANIAETPFRSLVDWTPNLAFYPAMLLGTQTKNQDLVEMGNWAFLGSDGKKFLARPSLKSRFCIQALKKGLADAPWKIAYLRRYLLIPLPYLKIFRMICKAI